MNRHQTTITTLLAIALAVTAAWASAVQQRPRPAGAQDGIAVYFSPDGGCTDAIIHEIGFDER